MAAPDELPSLRGHQARVPMGARATAPCRGSEDAPLLPKKFGGRWNGRSEVLSTWEQKSRIMVRGGKSLRHGLAHCLETSVQCAAHDCGARMLQGVKEGELCSETGYRRLFDRRDRGFAFFSSRRTLHAQFFQVSEAIPHFPRVFDGRNGRTGA